MKAFLKNMVGAAAFIGIAALTTSTIPAFAAHSAVVWCCAGICARVVSYIH